MQYYVLNLHGDVVMLTDSQGNIIRDYTEKPGAAAYDAFGNQKLEKVDDNPFRYCAEYYDQETTFIYLRARYYDPNIGRFITEDPIKADGWNWYVYCTNNPIKYKDPSGLASRLRNLVDYTAGGQISWNANTKTASVTVGNVTQRYVVSNSWVYVNGYKVGYMENDSIMVEEFDFNNDFRIVGELTIYAYYNTWEIVSGSALGHVWLEYHTLDGSDVRVETPRGQTSWGSSFTASTWNGGETTVLNRDWDRSHMNTQYTRKCTIKLTSGRESDLVKLIKSKSVDWSWGYNCAGYAHDIFETITGRDLTPYSGTNMLPKDVYDWM